MKNLILLFAMLFSFSAFAHNINPIKKSVNVKESVIEWKGYKVTGSHTGTIAVKSGNFEFDENGMLNGGNFVIDMATIEVTDLKGNSAAKLKGHLTSTDFFGVENHPEATFNITNVISRGTAGQYKIIGNLTIKNITKEIKFNANIDESAATAELVIDRSEYDIRYGSGSFFDNLGDKTIYDEFELAISLVF
jgi:polyisoprenoid-binding protein YceI